jgi:PHP family Zn ribbon phosphoesterase
MIYFADLHVHSRFSRATSRDCNLRELARWASLKGTRVVATGDCVHPGWRSEIYETLIPCDDGLFRIRDDKLPHLQAPPDGFPPSEVRFILNVEISSIYKKNGATRRVHNLVFMPDLGAVERFARRLARLGNIESDGRPILGLDARNILEIALDASEESFLIPAHVWTPWFSALGSKSGFDSIEECFEDLSPHVFALETGLSSDPDMNRLVSALDRYTLVSNSDTHSPGNLAREVNVFEGVPGYVALRESIRRGGGAYRKGAADTPADSVSRKTCEDAGGGAGDPALPGERGGFIGTIEFFPEEGKYHLDGHRKCGVRLEPSDTFRLGGLCPVCGRPVTVGVVNRVVELADREVPGNPEKAAPFWRMIPLAEIVAQSFGVGSKTIKAQRVVQELIERMGPELGILWAAPLDHDALKPFPVVREGIARVRRGEVRIEGGYDGEYGAIHLFTREERSRFAGPGGLPGRTVRRDRAKKTALESSESRR